MDKVIAVIGEVCSGKDTYAKRFPRCFSKVDVGDIVRMLTKTEKRTHNKDLDQKIIEELQEAVMEAYDKKKTGVVITGIRQFSIMNYLEVLCETMGWAIDRVILDVPQEILRKRYANSTRLKDTDFTFDEAREKDDKLGLSALFDYVRSVNHQVIQNYSRNE